ncbi:hypothetical protein PIB30_059958 [Stylosanthes scabra]|uniref:Endoplasmic reticulum transmembrane protein n=1 Tax=Stylosanthes scabra TaxID=79078 RepID=A0ABU6SKH4_9FABA|nr:hypothetical protein [Stylosanthes scabra]
MFNISSNLVIYLPSEKSDAKFDRITVEQKIQRYKFASRKLTSENRSTLNPTKQPLPSHSRNPHSSPSLILEPSPLKTLTYRLFIVSRRPLSLNLSLSLSHRSHALYPTDLTPMALECLVLGYAAAAEAIMVFLLIIPGLDSLRRGLIAVTCNLLKPFLSMVPFCLFLLMDIYWKYETRPSCEGDSCTPTEHLRHQKSIMKTQRNALLIASALLFYCLLYSVTNLVVKIDQLNHRVERLKNRD